MFDHAWCLQSLDLGDDEEEAASTSSPADAASDVNNVYLGLRRQGFQRPQVEAALSALPLAEAAVASALDWLLLHLEPADLPARYVDNTRSRGPVELLHKPTALPAAARRDAEQAQQRQAAAAAQAAQAAAAAAAAAAAEEAVRRKAQEEQEKESRRAWILQYAEESSDSGGGASGGGSPRSAASEVVEDWEVWGDPREIERRRNERRRGALPRDQRLALIAEELAAAKAGAAAAKAAGDKGRQRGCGQVIGYLKQEMAELGVTDEELPWQQAPAASPAAPAVGGGGAEAAEGAGSAGGGDRDGAVEGAAADADGAGSDSDDGLPAFDMFGDDESSQLESAPRARRTPAALAAAALLPWGGAPGVKKGGKQGAKAAPAPSPQPQQPKALLQQLCQRQGWPAPRYERLAPGGGRLESGAGLRYSVAVDPGAGPKKRGPKSQAQQGPRTFCLREADDGWERVEEAQAAAATLALLELCGGEQPELWRQLAPPYNGLWLAWQEEGAGAAEEETPQEGAAREEFVRQLVRRKQAEAAATAAAAAAGALGASSEPRASLWSEQLTRALGQAPSAQQVAARRADSERMLRALREWRGGEEGARWQAERARLPVSELRAPLAAALASHDVVVVSGETGSGKTTQVPQYLLEAATEAGGGGECSVVCTQPRRIAAISVAERVAAERGELAPGRRGGRVGYAVRLDSASTPDTRLLFCTTGILLRRLAGDPALAEASHVVVDEVHERTLQGEPRAPGGGAAGRGGPAGWCVRRARPRC
jgi:ATP-dependent RNA helicase DHX29